MFNSRYDAGDLASGFLATFGIGNFVGIGSSTIYGVSFNDQLLSLGSTSVPISYGAILAAVMVTFVTNAQMSLVEQSTDQDGKIHRRGDAVHPVLFMFPSGMWNWMLASYMNGTVVGFTFDQS